LTVGLCVQDKGNIDWTPRQIAITIDAFQCGDLFGRLPGGLLSQRYGGKRLLGFTLLVASLSTVLIPLTAGVHFTVVVLLRFIAGFTAVRCIYPQSAIQPKDVTSGCYGC